MRYFDGIETLQAAKEQFKKLAQKLHPDKGGSTADFIEMKNEYEQVVKLLSANEVGSKAYMKGKGEYKTAEEIFGDAMEYMEKIVDIINFPDIVVELCGTWLWVTGKTKEVKEQLKEAGFKWAAKKQAWYWHSGGYRKWHRKNYTLDEIRWLHGSTLVAREERRAIEV